MGRVVPGEAALATREASVSALEVDVTARETALSERLMAAGEIRAAADARDAVSDAREIGGDTREQHLDRAHFLASGTTPGTCSTSPRRGSRPGPGEPEIGGGRAMTARR